jgi:hypothetical protein
MWLMYGVCVVVTELMHDFGDAVMVAFGKGGSDGGFETVKVLNQLCVAHTSSNHERHRSPVHTVYELRVNPRRMSAFW